MSTTASRGIRARRASAVRQVRRLALAGVLTGLLGTSILSATSPAAAAEVPLSQGRNAIASSAERGDLSAAAAVDGKTGTRWSSKFSDPQWLAVDLGRSTAIKKIVMNWQDAYATAFRIQTATGSNGPWKTVYSTTAGKGGVQTVNVSATGRYVRLYATKRSGRYGVSLWEFQVFGTGSGTSTPTPTPTKPTPTATPTKPTPSATPTKPTPSATPTKPTPSATPTTGTPTAGWVPVNQAEWKKALDAYNKVAPETVPAGIVRVPEFQTNCTVSNQAKDDPIVLPGLPGASHMHTFFGPKVTATTTPADLLASSTTCDAPGDNSAYWVPQLLRNGKAVPIKNFRVYYGARLKDPSEVVPFPPGLVAVQGDAKRNVATPKGAPGQFWCAGSAEIGRSADGNWPVCAQGGNLIYQLMFQDCWDGKHIDSPDHKSHMGPMKDGRCSGAYPVAVPNISLMVGYDSLGGDGLALSSGMPSSMHGDFMNAWKPEKLGALVKVCINARAKCGTTPGWGR
ncbi:hypothetical protein Misp01_79060 [Microtetraspora sp. NBRC 13810]|uniref:DUF1996 domain-containing protein n=1 Tax=Microtetraspora sp. NBRC 13810 TaxID=3030990 RepID=UPI0024A3BA2B|nr:DUF1996 domain-containing protein [Microtetraspora sp. NBRC 13810]GLW12778.1 hypothetical protein Misp01_79060 [Microtetraspora sp. NBRC 13810]